LNKPTHYRGQSLIDLTCSPAELPAQPALVPREPRPVYHGDECSCITCCDLRASVDIYLKQRKLAQLNGFN
jgi:hypothetical protein